MFSFDEAVCTEIEPKAWSSSSFSVYLYPLLNVGRNVQLWISEFQGVLKEEFLITT